MNPTPFALALLVGASLLQSPARALPSNDPRTPINAVHTPGDADSVFRIDQPGSYYLEANLAGEAGKSGIEIAADDVRIDLMGFRLRGGADSSSAIVVNATQRGLTILNGTITEWGWFGVDGLLAFQTRVRDLEITHCQLGGIKLAADAKVELCRVHHTPASGIFVGNRSTVSDSTVQNAQHGIRVGTSSLVEDCIVDDILLKGIDVGFRSTVRGSVANNCDGGAIHLDGDSSVISCTASRSLVGIFSFGDVRVIDSTMTNNDSDGVRIDSGLVRGCTIRGNAHHGIEAALGAHVVGNLIAENGLDGIRAEGRSRIEDNDIREHAQGAGIRVSGTGSYIVKNTLTRNASTILVPNAGNFLGSLVSANAVNGRNDPWANLYTN